MVGHSKYDVSYRPLIFHYENQRPVNWQEEFGCRKPVDVEIGAGLGEFLVRLAEEHPDRNFVGIEQQWRRARKILRKIEVKRRDLSSAKFNDNIRVLYIDAHIALERYFKTFSIDRIYCLFPCPWPKKRHVKYRLFSHEFFKLLNSRLVKNGEVRIVTDALPFFNWILEEVKDTGFRCKSRIIQPQFGTKYEQKWFVEGQKEFFELFLIKTRHCKIPFKKDTPLKVYFAEQFHPEKFKFQDVAGERSPW